MEKVILIGGKAGQGIDKTSFLLAKTLTNLGYFVFNYRDYPSLIRGGHNFNVLKIGDRPVYSHENDYDLMIALDQKTIALHQHQLKREGIILGDKNLQEKRLVGLNLQAILNKLQAPAITSNNILLGALFKILGLPLTPLFKVLEKEFGTKADLLQKAAQEGYQTVKLQNKLFPPSQKKPNYFLSGSQAVVSGALFSGLDVYLAYPMTPATPVLHLLSACQKKEKISVHQLENEIAVINAALGASFAGAVSMVGTSGGGFALMSEAMSLAGMAEIPLVVYLAQRTSPATGVPTYTSQGDLKFAVNVGHGEFPRVVVAPGDPQEAIKRTVEAFYLAYKYQILSILLADKHLAESGMTFSQLAKPQLKTDRFLVENPDKNYQRYLITKSGLSPRAVPGQGPWVRATGYEHDESGLTTEDSQMTKKMNDKRLRKKILLEKEIKHLHPVNLYGQGENLIVGWGSTKGAILDALKKLDNFRFMQIVYLRPFPVDQVEKELNQAKKVILVENNATGLLGQILREQTGYFIKEKILKYDGRPFTSEEIVKGVKRSK